MGDRTKPATLAKRMNLAVVHDARNNGKALPGIILSPQLAKSASKAIGAQPAVQPAVM